MIKIFLLFLQCVLIRCFNLQKITASLLLSSSLHNPMMLENQPLPENIDQPISVLQNKHPPILENNFIHPTSVQIVDNNIYFYGSITSESCKELNDALLLLDKNSKIFSVNFGIDPPPINLHIQSEGGSLMNTFYIVDLIKHLQTPVYTYVDGYVASAGSLISVMGTKRYMTKNSFIMIHQLSSSLGEGKFNDLDDNMDNLNKFMNTIVNIYLEKTKIPIVELNTILDHDLWMTSNECLEYGLVDEIL